MLVECLKIVFACLLVIAIGVPAVSLFAKWKKEMDEEETE